MTQSAQEIVNIDNQQKSPSQRIWEVDFLRGFLLLFVVLDHLMFNLWYFCQHSKTALFSWLYTVAVDYYDAQTFLGGLQTSLHNGFIMAFVFIAGVSSNFSTNNSNRALKMTAVALILTALTNLLSQVIYRPLEINFNVIHVIAVCCFVYCWLEQLKRKQSDSQRKVTTMVTLAVAVALGVVGYCFHVNPVADGGLFVVFVNCGNSVTFSPADYLPLFPALSYFIVGSYIGKIAYKKGKSLFGQKPKFVQPLCWCGQKSLYVYLASQLAMFVFFYLFAHLVPVL